MSASIEPTKDGKSRKGGTHRESVAAAGEAADRTSGERAAGPAGPAKEGKQRTWMEAHGGGFFIGVVFALIALLVVVRTACN